MWSEAIPALGHTTIAVSLVGQHGYGTHGDNGQQTVFGFLINTGLIEAEFVQFSASVGRSMKPCPKALSIFIMLAMQTRGMEFLRSARKQGKAHTTTAHKIATVQQNHARHPPRDALNLFVNENTTL